MSKMYVMDTHFKIYIIYTNEESGHWQVLLYYDNKYCQVDGIININCLSTIAGW